MSHYDRTKSIKFNYYNNLATPSNLENRVHYSYKGKENQPNVVFIDSGKIQSFTAHDLYIFKNGKDGGELLIENKPITNYGKSLFLSFPLVPKSTSKPTEIDNLVHNRKTQELDLNRVLPNDTSCSIQENMDGIQLNFMSPINIQSDLSSLLGNPSSNMQQKMNIIEGLTNAELTEKVLQLEGEADSGYRIECTEVDIDGNEAQDALYRIPVKNKQLENNQFVYYFFVFLLVIGGSYGFVGFIYWYRFKSAFESGFDIDKAKTTVLYTDIYVTLFFGIMLIMTNYVFDNKEWFTWTWVGLVLYFMGAFGIYLTPTLPLPKKVKQENASRLDNMNEVYFWSWTEFSKNKINALRGN